MEKERQEIGRFYAKAHNGNVIEFIAFNDNTIDCPSLGINFIKKMLLKPRFLLFGKDFYYTFDAKPARRDTGGPELIKEYAIDEDLFIHLKEKEMIKYSTDMAYLYEFIDKNGYDKGQYSVPSPFKWAAKKGKTLVKQRNGLYN